MNKHSVTIQNQQHQGLETGSEPVIKSPYQMVISSSKALTMKNCTDDEIKNAYKYIFVLLGLGKDDLPDELEKAVLIDFTRQFWGVEFSAEDIINAFKLSLAGLLVDDDGKDIDTSLYGKRFSVQFVKRFMSPYKKYRSNVLKKAAIANRLEQNKDSITEYKNSVSNENDVAIFNHVIDYITREKVIPNVWPVEICFKIINERFSFDDDPEYYSKLKELARTEQLRQMKTVKAYNSDNADLDINKSVRLKEIQSATNLDYEIKRQHCINYFKKMLETGTNGNS